ncbi:unnamed protein product, partial [Fusarium langsethiae]
PGPRATLSGPGRFIFTAFSPRDHTHLSPYATHGFRFTHAQRTGLEELWSRLQDEEQPSDDGLQEQILQILATFWTQRLDGDPFESPLWHFVGVLGIDGETGQLRSAHLFTYVLAGLVFTGRALLGEWAIPTRERAGMADLAQRFAKVRDLALIREEDCKGDREQAYGILE